MLNRKNLFGTAAILFVFILLTAFSSCGKSDEQTSDKNNMEMKNNEVKEVSNVVDSSDIGPLYTCPMHPNVEQNFPGKCPECKMDLVKKEDQPAKIEGTVYTCPMHPMVEANHEGTCPLCKMKLVEKKDDDHMHEN
jgi:Heavy metal binding domain